MEKKKISKHGKRHRPRDAYEVYELEHMPWKVQLAVDRDMEDERNDNHGRQHMPRDAYELYELEHMPHMPHNLEGFPSYSVRPSVSEAARPRPHQFDEETMVQSYWRPSSMIYQENIDSEAQDFIESKHEKFALSRWMSADGY